MSTTPFLQQKIEDCKQMYNIGSTRNDLVEVLHDQGLSLPEVCQVVAAVLGIDPVEARVFVAENPIWTEVIENESAVGREVLQVLARDGAVDDVGDGVVVYREVLADETLFSKKSKPDD